MRLSIQVTHLVQDKKTGIWKYRRRVPASLKLAIGKGELGESLGTKDEAVAIARYPKVHDKFEAILKAAGAVPKDQLVYNATLGDLKRAGLIDETASEVAPVPLDYDAKFNQWTEAILREADSLSQAERNGPLRLTNPAVRMAVAKFQGLKKPQATFSQAVEHYLTQRTNRYNKDDLTKQVGLVQRHLSDVSNLKDPPLSDIDLDIAEAFRDRMLAAGNSPTTVLRRIGTIKAVLNLYIKDKRLKNEVENAFNGMSVPDPDGPADRDRRDALTLSDIAACAPEIRKGNDDLQATWLLQMFTGARPTEISGLSWTDVHLQAQVPYVVLRLTETRRVKGKYSAREVPLVGKALEMMRDRNAKRVPTEPAVFPRYSTKKKRAALSNLQIDKMKAAGVWKPIRKVPYSLRHSMQDWMMRSSGADWADMVLGLSDVSSYGAK